MNEMNNESRLIAPVAVIPQTHKDGIDVKAILKERKKTKKKWRKETGKCAINGSIHFILV